MSLCSEVEGRQELPYPNDGVGEEANAMRKRERRLVRRWGLGRGIGSGGGWRDGIEEGDGERAE